MSKDFFHCFQNVSAIFDDFFHLFEVERTEGAAEITRDQLQKNEKIIRTQEVHALPIYLGLILYLCTYLVPTTYPVPKFRVCTRTGTFTIF